MPRGSSSPAIGNWPIVPVAAGALAIAIFVFDTLTHLEIAVGVFYVAVVLIVVRSFDQRAVLLVAAGCMVLAVLSYLLSREGPLSVTALANLAIDLSAIATATYLALRNQSAERALTDQFRLVIDTIPTLAWRTRPDGYAEFFNRRWQEYTGLSLEQAQGWGWTDAIHPDDVAGLTDTWRAILGDGRPGETEARMRRGDGAYRWFLFRAEPLRDERGNIVKWYGTYTDIEDRKRGGGGAARAGRPPRPYARHDLRARHERRDHLLESRRRGAVRLAKGAGARQFLSPTHADDLSRAARRDHRSAAPRWPLGRGTRPHEARRHTGHCGEPVVFATGRAGTARSDAGDQ